MVLTSFLTFNLFWFCCSDGGLSFQDWLLDVFCRIILHRMSFVLVCCISPAVDLWCFLPMTLSLLSRTVLYVNVWDSCSRATVEIFWSSSIRGHVIGSAGPWAVRVGSVHTGLLYQVAPAPDSGHGSSHSSVFSYSQGISVSLWSWRREPDWSPVLPHVELDSLFSIGAETLSASACCRPTAQRLAAAARSLTCFHSISHPQRCLQWVCGQLCVLNVLFATVTYHDDESGTMPPCLDLSLCFLPGGTNGIP